MHFRPVPAAVTFAVLTTALMVPVLGMLALGTGLGSDSGPALPAIRLWPCLVTASVAGVLCAWIWSLRAGESAARLFCASGAATYAFCLGAAVFSLPGPLTDPIVTAAIAVNVIGASAFGIVMIALFARYPSRLPGAQTITLAALLLFGAWTIAAFFGPVKILIEIHRITLAEMVVILALAAAQIVAARADPVARAIAIWLGAAVGIGAGGFIALVALPNAILRPALVPEEFGFLFFVIIYIALAVALVRYRIFGLGRWAFQLLFIVAAGLAVLAVDALIIVVLAMDAARATGIALVLVALAYLPARAWLWQRLIAPPRSDGSVLLREAAGVALAPTGPERERAWRDLLAESFDPLAIEPVAERYGEAVIDEEGRSLLVPGPDGFAALRLRDRNRGRRLFSPADLALARELGALVAQLGEARSAYDRGAAFERARIAQDIHDNIGAHLLTALHAPSNARKDELIRETIGDLRDVIRNAEDEPLALDALLADLRIETADRVELAGLELEWTMPELPDAPPPRETVRALRALLREAVSNVLRHASASRIAITIAPDDGLLGLTIADDGTGFDPAVSCDGRGLGNMRRRIEGLGGSFALASDPQGTRIVAGLPLQT
ncbi:MAG: ATP-binding protein [Erythrobacter sp.]|jgi:signal transduction histidine kinase|nr:ATP-binding protein [Erythrobacter sp.]